MYVADQLPLFADADIPVIADAETLTPQQIWMRRHKVGLVEFAESSLWIAYDNKYQCGPDDAADVQRWIANDWAVSGSSEYAALAEYARRFFLPWPF
jgi:hypothetical protein